MKVLGLIPARGGSKGLPRKNVRVIGGKPLVAWSIEAALASSALDRVVVSTDDEEIRSIAERWGAEVLDRPAELAADDSTSLSVWQHALCAYPARILVNLFPTCPIRDDGLIDAAVARFTESGATCLATGCIRQEVPFGTTEEGMHTILRRQDIEGFFWDDGSVVVVDAETVNQGRQYGDRLECFHNSRECSIDIDDEFDFWIAEKILEKRMAVTDER